MWSRVGGLTFFFCHISFSLLLSWHKGQHERAVWAVYQHYVASAVSLNMQQLWKHGSSIQEAIIRCKAKPHELQSCVWNSTLILTLMWPLRHYVNLKMAIFLTDLLFGCSAVCLFVLFPATLSSDILFPVPESQQFTKVTKMKERTNDMLHKGKCCIALKLYRHVSCD